jgi:GWxTD domain-containing protein
MKAKTSTIILFFLLISSLFSSTQKIKEKDLPQKYRDWLKYATYIIHKKEKDVFMQLVNERDRDIFVKTFWKKRDPTPGTPLNEYKEEILRRFNYANKRLKYGTPKQGWRTDMGMMYIILGPPVSIERIASSRGLYPCQIWSYYGDPKKGLPIHFSLVFFQRGGAGEYKLYSPISDGPASLLIMSRNKMDTFDYELLYREIMELAPGLALVSLSLIPGEVPFNFQPSLQSATIIADIMDSPKKDINPSYATHFLDYRGIVSTEYLLNYVESAAEISFLQDPVLNISFLHFSIAPEKVSVDYFEPKDQYFCNYKLDVNITVENDIIFQYSKDFPFYFSPDDLKKLEGNGIAIEDTFPFIDGKYKLHILLRNSVGNEFSVIEKEISLSEDSTLPKIIGFFLGYKFQGFDSSRHIPFKVLDKKLLVDPKNTFSSTETVAILFSLANVTENLWREGEVKFLIKGLRPEEPTVKSFSLKLKDYPFQKMLSTHFSIPARELTPDYYEIKLNLIDGKGDTVDEKNGAFVISPKNIIPHPIARSKAFPLTNNFLYFYVLATMYDKVNEYEKAEFFFTKAYGLKPDYKQGLISYANFLLKVKKFTESLELIETIKEDESLKFNYYFLKGKVQMGMGNYAEAINNLLEGNKIYNSDTGLLNSLGLCYYKTLQKEKALNVLNVSLRLNPEQTQIKKLIEEIEKSID